MENIKIYNAMENTLQIINSDYVSLSQEEMAENNAILDMVLTYIIERCRDTSELFEKMYRGPFYGGSYYDGLKIRRPDEYDIDIKLAITCDARVKPSDKDGYVNVRLTPERWNRNYGIRRPYFGERGLHVLTDFDDCYLDTKKAMIWMHQVLSTSLKGRKRGKTRIVNNISSKYGTFKLKFKRKGPAFTFRVSGFPNIDVICFDLVPCFVFGEDQWPYNFVKNMVPDKKEFFIVPKPHDNTKYWRLSFQEQERILLIGKENLKPALRLIKKMRDKLRHDCISSYFIKTVFLWKVIKTRKDHFWNKPLSYVFMKMLQDYQGCIQRGVIKYFWCPRFNLIENIDDQTLSMISNDLKYIINNLKSPRQNETLVAKYLLSNREYKSFRRQLRD